MKEIVLSCFWLTVYITSGVCMQELALIVGYYTPDFSTSYIGHGTGMLHFLTQFIRGVSAVLITVVACT